MCKELNEFQRSGHAFVELIKRISTDRKSFCNEDLQILLSCFHLEEGWKLGIRFAGIEPESASGDISSLFVYSEKELKDLKNDAFQAHRQHLNEVFQHISVDATPLGAWQALLCVFAPTILPTIWHGGYIKRTLVFSKDELKHIRTSFSFAFITSDFIVNQLGERDIIPMVEMNNNIATIDFYSWSDWSGLMRETYEVVFSNDNHLISLQCIDTEILVEYNCHVYF